MNMWKDEEQMTSQHIYEQTPLIQHKHYDAPSLFTPENLLREARQQKKLPEGQVPLVCVLDPDGDLVDYLSATGRTQRNPTWACYHTVLYTFEHAEVEYGIIGRVVGASFAVLVAEELFASRCKLLISITSAGQIISMGQPPYVVLIEKALRDEGTSYHYLPPSRFSHLHPSLREAVSNSWKHTHIPLHLGASWTTDAPFRETEAARQLGILAVEMEAAALYALAQAKQYDIICFAHVTNSMGQTEGDFEKGEASGSTTALDVIRQTTQGWYARQS
ncbi:MAG TPA: nucleoside phosphorylase [Ktedonobacteraceae bacterium]|nr:nucleoside phosphorylase [Ktedonobacteraceae bacterium]